MNKQILGCLEHYIYAFWKRKLQILRLQFY